MAYVTVTTFTNFQPDDLFLGVRNDGLVSVDETVRAYFPEGAYVTFSGTGLQIDTSLANPWVSGTVEGITLYNSAGSPVVFISGLSVDAVELGSVLGADSSSPERSNDIMRYLLSGDDYYRGGYGENPDVIYTGLGDDSIDAGAGDDIIHSGPGAATINGGSGVDTINFAEDYGYPAGYGVSVNLGDGTGTSADGGILEISNVEDVVGSFGNDTITGDDSSNRLFGSDGDDSVSGAGGSDLMVGGTGNDTLDGGSGDDYFAIGDMYLNEVQTGNKVLIGGEGQDSAILNGYFTDYSFRFDDGGHLVFTHKETGNTYSLDGIETVVNGATGHSVEAFRPVDIAGQSVNEDGVWTFKLSEGAYREGTTFVVTDLNGNQLPAWISFDPETRTFTGTPPEDFNGTIGVKVSANDLGIPKTSTFNLEVRPVNDAPTRLDLTSGWVWENAEKGKPVGVLVAKDGDGDSLSYSLVDDAGGRFKIDGNKLVVADGAKLDHEQAKLHTVTVQVSDGKGGSLTQSFKVEVRNVDKEDVKGGTGNDAVKGGSGNDKIGGGLGKDVLTGGKGKDAFVFDTKAAKDNVDKIADFSVKDDQINLDNAVFSKLGKKGSESSPVKMSKDFFTIGSKAKDKNDYVVYDNKKGVLYYDADGSGKGKAVEIATLSKNLKMTAADFFVI